MCQCCKWTKHHRTEEAIPVGELNDNDNNIDNNAAISRNNNFNSFCNNDSIDEQRQSAENDESRSLVF